MSDIHTQRSRRFHQAGWGVFLHYLVDPELSSDAWNRQVEAFDASGLADQLAAIGAGYLGFTIGQTSGHYCAPNPVYDDIAGVTPSKCSRRDLIADLARELRKRGMWLMVYSCSQAPLVEPEMSRFGWEWGFDGPTGAWSDGNGAPLPRTGKRLADFQRKWEAVHRHWSEQWGDLAAAWWVDSCYFADAMYAHADAPNFASFTAAMRAGNPDAAVAFNNGWVPPVTALTEEADYTAGEAALVLPSVPGRFTDPDWHAGTFPPPHGKQVHVLSYLGSYWARPDLRFPDAMVEGYTRHVIENGGAVTWDVAVDAEGRIPKAQLDQLRTLASLRRNREAGS